MNLSHALEAAVRSTTAPRATLLAGLENTSEAIGVGPDGDQHLDSHSSKVAAQAARGTSGRMHKQRGPAPAAESAPLVSRDRDSVDDGAYRLLGSLTTASQLTSDMLAETRRTSKRLSRTRRRGSASGRVSQRLGQHRPLVVPLRRQHRGGERHSPGCGVAGHCPRAGGRPRTGRREPCQASRVLSAGERSANGRRHAPGSVILCPAAFQRDADAEADEQNAGEPVQGRPDRWTGQQTGHLGGEERVGREPHEGHQHEQAPER
jgi:hypothetical protein